VSIWSWICCHDLTKPWSNPTQASWKMTKAQLNVSNQLWTTLPILRPLFLKEYFWHLFKILFLIIKIFLKMFVCHVHAKYYILCNWRGHKHKLDLQIIQMAQGVVWTCNHKQNHICLFIFLIHEMWVKSFFHINLVQFRKHVPK
jgi:hypothetical protein